VLWIDVQVKESDDNITLTVDLQWFQKTSTRLPEAFWLTFNPVVTSNDGWKMDKLGLDVDPLDVILNGSQHQHGVWDGITYTDKWGEMWIQSLDAGIVSPDIPTPFPTPLEPLVGVKHGMSFCLYNNIWNTNYILWYPYTQQIDNPDANAKFRFSIAVSSF